MVGTDPLGHQLAPVPQGQLCCSAVYIIVVLLQVEQTPENFRTIGALRRTMMHLRNIMDRRDMPLVNIHKYLWDRFRGVRQDLFVQGIEVRGPPSFVQPLLCSACLPAGLPRKPQNMVLLC